MWVNLQKEVQDIEIIVRAALTSNFFIFLKFHFVSTYMVDVKALPLFSNWKNKREYKGQD